jgi:Uma2 family endonuclease
VVALGGGRLKETLTAKDLFRLPSELTEDGCYELLEGKLYKMPPPGPRHGEVTLNIGVILRSFVRVRELGRVMVGDPGFILRRDPDSVRGPDVAYVSYERHPANEDLPSRYIELAPDLAVEVVSPSQTRTYVDEKAAAWLAAGVITVWVVDPRTNQVAVHRAGQAPTVLSSDDTLDGSPALPGFTCRVAEFFR